VLWKTGSKLECLVLVELLDAHPLRGRKLAQYAIWRDAVARWASKRQGFAPGVREHLARLAAQPRAERVYTDSAVNATIPDLTDSHAVNYFGGFFSGEGSFALARRNARFLIKLRRDDRPLLKAFQRHFGIGSVVDVLAWESAAPAAVWHVTGARDVLMGIALLDSAHLLGRKARQYEAWRPGAEAIGNAVISRSPVDEAILPVRERPWRTRPRTTRHRPR
jgi:hypothetical protein